MRAALFAPRPAPASGPAARQEWEHFKAHHLTDEGRIADNMNGGISHSEGQGFAMLLAVRFNEPDLFARILRWTRGRLARPQDMLLAWAWRPHDANTVPDRNNATDGDLLVAWALAEAAQQWQVPAYRSLAEAMARDILRHLVAEAGDRLALLPGIHGFRQNDGFIINPSYYVFPAFQALRVVLPARQWSLLEESGLRLMRHARFGRWGLVPDWVALGRGGGRPGLAPGRPARFSYDAVRVPLYMVWAGFAEEPAVRAAAEFWHDPAHRQMPAWVDLRTDRPAPYAADAGITAIASLAACAENPAAQRLEHVPPALADAYYASALRLLARQADTERPAPRSLT
jgi:endoglucanase